MSYDSIVQHLRDKYNEGVILSLESRKAQLQAFYKLVSENQDAICEAMWKDLRKSKAECLTHETDFLLAEISDAISNLKSWTAPTKVTRYILQAADSAYIQKDPLGVVLIIGSWNFPTRLLLAPAIGAIAAGNTVVLKPCRVSFATATLVEELVPKYLSPDVVRVIQGGAAETTELLKQRFDHIFYTGNPNVGKLIMKAASEHLTPVTLELGGKNPVIIDKDVDLQTVARRIVWGKCANAGQICVTADYILNLNPKRDELVKHISEAIIEFYGQNQKESPDFGRIVNDRHFDRVAALLESTKGEIAFGGDKDKESKYIQPTVVVDVKTDDILLQEEIFGPILPIVNMETIEEAIQYIKSKEKPLALYVFSQSSSRVDKVIKNTSSGAITVNDLIMHMSLETLPFGGVGHSGMGRYHGKFTFDTFTHEKSVLSRAAGLEKLLFMRYPPHDETKLTWARRFFAKLKVPF